MSILPLPDPAAPSGTEQQTEGFHLSALDTYAGQPGALPGVSFWPRVAARVIDLVVHYIVTFVGGLLFGILVAMAAAIRHTSAATLLQRGTPGDISLFVFTLLGSIMLEAICEGFHGSTPGKLVLGMTVVQEDGTPCRFGSALVRSFAYLIDGLFFGLIGYFNMQKSPQQQRHGDEWAHTVVARRVDVAPQNRRSGGWFVVAFFFGAMADIILAVTAMLIHYS